MSLFGLVEAVCGILSVWDLGSVIKAVCVARLLGARKIFADEMFVDRYLISSFQDDFQ